MSDKRANSSDSKNLELIKSDDLTSEEMLRAFLIFFKDPANKEIRKIDLFHELYEKLRRIKSGEVPEIERLRVEDD